MARSSFHLVDAASGLTVGAVTAGLALWWRRPLSTAVALAAAAGAISITMAVGRGLLEAVSLGAALAALLVAASAGTGLAWLARRLAPLELAALVLVTEIGVWAAVPDTEAAVVLVASTAPFGVLAVAGGRRAADLTRFHASTALPWIGLALVVAWAAVWGGSARPAVQPGALACFGATLVAPWTLPLARVAGWCVASLLVVHTAAVALAARWATRSGTVADGVLRSLAVLAILGLVLWVTARLGAPAHRRPSGPPEHRP